MNSTSFQSNPGSAAAGVPPKTSGLAVASLILGLLGFLILPALGGLICGLMAMSRIKQSAGRLKGHGLALSGTIISGLMLLIFPVLAILTALLLPALASAKSKAHVIMSVNNVKQLGLASLMYATDSGDRLPTPARWCDLVKPMTAGNATVFLRPADQGGPMRSSYGYNVRLADAKLGDVHKDTVLIFELESGGWNIAGGPELIRRPSRGRDQVIVGFADGHVEAMSGTRLDSLRWDP